MLLNIPTAKAYTYNGQACVGTCCWLQQRRLHYDVLHHQEIIEYGIICCRQLKFLIDQHPKYYCAATFVCSEIKGPTMVHLQ